jgi:ABC-type transport system involved in multi-copper enzyme maturation permease subunit
MLWLKWWIDTRHWFILGVLLLSAQVLAFYMSYPMDPATTFPNGALGVLPPEMPLLRGGDFRSYVWLRWFSTSMLLFWPLFAIALAGTGFEKPAGREYLLSLPVSRRRAAAMRLIVVLLEIAGITVLPTLLLCAMAPLRGQYYPVSEALAHSAIFYVAGLGLVGLTMFLRAIMADVAAYVAMAAMVFLVGMFTFLATGFTPYSVFRLMNGADYFFNHHVPWAGLATSVAVGAVLAWLSVRLVEARDF